ncbi:MAG: type III-A CRISPR-associated protein Csm2 [Deltaproteobacteria bacterium]|nr:type III-A CRISPR-associated protein Csm2 [Deltaproteobacteria bacterium]
MTIGEIEKKIPKSLKAFPVTDIIACAESLGQILTQGKEKDRLSTSQIRNIFGEVRKIQMRGYGDGRKFKLLEPRLAYVAGKHGGKVEDLAKVLRKCIVSTNDQDDFNVFVDFFEAILAYHKASGGK